MSRDDPTSDPRTAGADPLAGSPVAETTPPNLRTRRRQLMQDDLARIAIRLFLDRGYDSVSVDQIAAAAGMSERSFFRYFPTKEAVLRRYRRSLSARLFRAFETRPHDESPLFALRRAYVESAHVPEADRPQIHSLERLLATTSEVWAKDLGETISDTAVAGELARRMALSQGDLRPNVLAAAISAAAATAWNSWAQSDGREDPGTLVAAAIDLLGLTS
ncbi:TetR family transcriptional regulator [Prescottella equi]